MKNFSIYNNDHYAQIKKKSNIFLDDFMQIANNNLNTWNTCYIKQF